MPGVELANVAVDFKPVTQRRVSIEIPIEDGKINYGYESNEIEKQNSTAAYQNGNRRRKSSVKPAITYSWNKICAWVGPDKSFPAQKINGDLNVNFKNKVLLNNVSGAIKPGQLIGLLGASGSGKTSLLDILTFRNSSKIKVAGQRIINNIKASSNTITSISAYVQQTDLFVGDLTVREHLIFHAQVRMDAIASFSERMDQVEKVIDKVGLRKCADTRIGTRWFKGISGGEVRRLSIATELLTDPMLMCCDEPLSGLDSYSAQNVMSNLKTLALSGKAVICSIHQPSSQIYSLFDRVMFMCEGRIAYFGTSDDCLEFFSQLGYNCPERYNPAEFVIDTLRLNDDNSRSKIMEICDAYESSPDFLQVIQSCKTISSYEDDIEDVPTYQSSIPTQFRAVLKRSWISATRNVMVFKMRFIQSVFIGLFVGTIYYQESFDKIDGIHNLSGAIFMMLCALTYQYMFGVLDTFCAEIPLFLREHFNGLYRTDVYYICKLLVEIPTYVILPAMQTAITYYMIGFNSDPVIFLKSAGILILVANTCAALGITLSCLAKSVTLALIAAPAFVFPFFLFGGFLVLPGTGVVFLRWIQHISWFYYGYETLAIVQLENIHHIDCNNNSTCPENGLVVLDSLKFNRNNFTLDIIVLCVLAIAAFLLGFLALFSRTLRR